MRGIMNIIFLTLLDFYSYSEHNIYCDVLREFIKHGHEVFCISPTERRAGAKTHLEENGHLLKLKIGNTQKTNILEKGISTMLIEPQFVRAIKRYFNDVKFDLVLYSTPPITFAKAIKYVKKRDQAKTYLMLKDIFPQNAVDLGMMSKSGIKGLIYKYFRTKEKQLYAISDRIGCMSQANVDYILKYNPEISREKVEICPNCIEVQNIEISDDERRDIRDRYGLPHKKKIFVYGGNLGKPQDIPFIIECLNAQKDNMEAYFLIVGDGTEYDKLDEFLKKAQLKNVKLIKKLPKDEYDKMIRACDVGLIFLDYHFTIPNFPSRLLSYMQAGLPVLACTDSHTDVGEVINKGGFGWWCESNNSEEFCRIVKEVLATDIVVMSTKSLEYLYEHYNSTKIYAIMEHFGEEEELLG